MSNILLIALHVFIVICVILTERIIIRDEIFKGTWGELKGLHFMIVLEFIVFITMAVSMLIYIKTDSPYVYFSMVRTIATAIVPIHFMVSRFKIK